MKLPNYDKEHLIFGLLFMLSNQLQTIGDSFFEEITTKQWFALSMLSILPDRKATLNELSEAMGSSHQNVKQIVNKLEQKGFLEYQKDEFDQRKLCIRMTPKCEIFNTKYANKSIEFMEKLFSELKQEDILITFQTLFKLKENLDALREEKKPW